MVHDGPTAIDLSGIDFQALALKFKASATKNWRSSGSRP